MSGWWIDDEGAYHISGVKVGNASIVAEDSGDPFSESWAIAKSELRGVSQTVRRRAARIEKRSESTSIQHSGTMVYGMFDVITPPYSLDELARYYETAYANHSAVDAKVANIVGLGHRWELSPDAVSKIDEKDTEKKRAAARKRIEKMKVEMEELLDDLTGEDTFMSVLEKVVTDLESTGNGYIEVGRRSDGRIGYIGHVPSLTVRVRRLRDGFCQIVGRDVVFFRNFQSDDPNPITGDDSPNELIHFKSYSPLNTYYGVPDTVAAGQAIVGDQYANQYNIDYFQNKATPRYIVTVKGAHLSAEAESTLFRFLQTNLRGYSHRTLYIPLPPDTDQNKVDFKMEAVEAGIQEGSFEKYHRQNREDILVAHQVPLSKVGLASGGTAESLASDRTFKEQVARPRQRQIEKRLAAIFKEFTDVLVLKLNELTLTDEMAQAQIDEKYLRSQTVTPNEVRGGLGMPPLPGGDKVVELSPRQAADARGEARQSDQRSIDRENDASDSPNTISGRKPKN